MPNIRLTYSLANSLGYTFSIEKEGYNPINTLSYYNKENFPDVELIRQDMDVTKLVNRYIFTVNGYIHKAVVSNKRLYILNGAKNMLKSRANSVGMISLSNIPGYLSYYHITPSMIFTDGTYSLYDKAIISFSGNTIDKPILSICGYMIFEDPQYFYRVSSNSFALSLSKLNYIEKIYELSRYRDIFNELGIVVDPNNSNLVDVNTVKSDSIVTKFLTTFNSFLINIPVNNLTIEPRYLEHSNVPGNFRTDIDPDMPLIVGYGKIGEYAKKINSDNKYTVYVNDAYYNNHLLSRDGINNINMFNNHRVIGDSYRLSRGYFLNISTTI